MGTFDKEETCVCGGRRDGCDLPNGEEPAHPHALKVGLSHGKGDQVLRVPNVRVLLAQDRTVRTLPKDVKRVSCVMSTPWPGTAGRNFGADGMHSGREPVASNEDVLQKTPLRWELPLNAVRE